MAQVSPCSHLSRWEFDLQEKRVEESALDAKKRRRLGAQYPITSLCLTGRAGMHQGLAVRDSLTSSAALDGRLPCSCRPGCTLAALDTVQAHQSGMPSLHQASGHAETVHQGLFQA